MSVISLQTPLNSSYTLNQGDTLKINPTVLQSNGKQKLTYEWEINHKLVSSDSALVYPIQTSGTYTGRLRLSNGQNIQIYEFNVNVEYAYTKGVFLLAEKDNKAILSYVPTEDVNKSFQLDVLGANNPNTNFGTPCSMAWNKTIGSQTNNVLIIAAGNPSTLYQLDGYEMLSLFQTPVGEKVIQVEANSDPGSPKVMAITKNNLYSLGLNSTNLISQTSRFTSAVGGSVREHSTLHIFSQVITLLLRISELPQMCFIVLRCLLLLVLLTVLSYVLHAVRILFIIPMVMLSMLTTFLPIVISQLLHCLQ